MVRNETIAEFSAKKTKRGNFFWQVTTSAGNKYSFFADTDDKEDTMLATVSVGEAGLFMFEEESYTDAQGEQRTSRKLKGIKEPEIDVNADMSDLSTPQSTTAYTNRDRTELLRISANNATALTKQDGEIANPEAWAVMFATILRTLDTEFWKI